MTWDQFVLLSDYEKAVANTDRFRDCDMDPILLGLFGEVGSIMSAAKKLQRGKDAYRSGYIHDVEEELGDVIWYLAALCRRCKLSLADLVSAILDEDGCDVFIVAGSDPHAPVARAIGVADPRPLHAILLALGDCTSRLLATAHDPGRARDNLVDFIRVYIEALQIAGVSFSAVLKRNRAKTTGRFLDPDPESLPDFDASFPPEEQLPRTFEIEIFQRANGKSSLRWKGVIIGDPLSDNILIPDDYRFHDVFHLSYAAILHWSPTFRSLIRHKRKSDPNIDEAEDGGRAIVVDEGVSAYVFSYAKELNFFEGLDAVSFDLLKAISNLVKGYEVAQCPSNCGKRRSCRAMRPFVGYDDISPVTSLAAERNGPLNSDLSGTHPHEIN